MTTFTGSGPGPQTTDGCSVELYARLPYGGELDVAIACLSPGATVLELGCGAGRGTRALIDAGLSVTAVDNSEDMLAYCPKQAKLVLADISALRLEERFDAVVLPTGLVNHVDTEVREAFVQCAARHVKADGWLFVQRQDPKWLATAVESPGGQSGGICGAVQSVVRVDRKVSITFRYWTDNETWLHSFQLLQLEEEDLQALVSQAGFGCVEWLNQDKTWLRVQRAATDA
jgi:cyclopropane fatty-acyl-phospholipid synthase-like methyltransferase